MNLEANLDVIVRIGGIVTVLVGLISVLAAYVRHSVRGDQTSAKNIAVASLLVIGVSLVTLLGLWLIHAQK